MYHVRTVRTASKSRAIQVVFYEHRKLKVATHIGSAKTEEGLAELRRLAAEWIKKETGQLVMFTEEGKLSLENFRYLGIRHSFLHEQVSGIFSRFGFESLGCPLLTDLALARVVEPASLLMSTALLEELFGIAFPRREFYRQLPTLPQWKERVEELVVALARAEFGFDFSLDFYDVTTLYFEAFESDELRKPGFSKDGKSPARYSPISTCTSSTGS